MAKVPKRLPQILSREQVARLFAHCKTLRERTLLETLYATGMRLSEVCALELSDIESATDRMCIKVRQGKGSKDRRLSTATLGVPEPGRRRPDHRQSGSAPVLRRTRRGRPAQEWRRAHASTRLCHPPP